jgi:hypothetical protein
MINTGIVGIRKLVVGRKGRGSDDDELAVVTVDLLELREGLFLTWDLFNFFSIRTNYMQSTLVPRAYRY